MRLKLGVLVGVLTVLALAGGGTAAMATETDDPGQPSLVAVAEGGDAPLTQARADEFAKCMRANGVPGLQAPKVTGGRFESVLPRDVDPEVGRKAAEKCAPALPGAPKFSAADIKKLKRYAKCMRANGIEGFPTPRADGSLQLGDGVDPESDEFQAADKACSKYAPKHRVFSRSSGAGAGEPELHHEPALSREPALHHRAA